MANVLAPFGFQPTGTVSGAAPNFRLSRRYIASTYSTAIFTGDVVSNVSGGASGYIQLYAATTTAVAGVFWGCKYLSTSQGRTVWSRYYPGSDAASDVTAYVIDNPDATFMVQSTYATAALGLSAIQQNVTVVAGTPVGNTYTGGSTEGVGATATTSTYPFTVVDLVTAPTGQNGTDLTTPYNYVIVTFNQESFKVGVTAF
jgi:hypothetical protein